MLAEAQFVTQPMKMKRTYDGIYFDNAATSFPKPASVEAAILDYHRNIGASAGRGAYPRAQASGKILDDTRKLLAQLFHISDPTRIIYTLNASDALNLAIKGISWKAGDSVVVSMMEHNSVLRPLHELQERVGIVVHKVAASSEGIVRAEDMVKAIDAKTKLIALLHASNVTGSIQPIAEVGAIARQKGIPFLVDASQSAGALPIDVEAMHIDLLAFPGHKALLGPLGTGGLYIHPSLDLLTLREGGTGSVSEQDIQPDFLPDRYEPGSHNALGIAGLKAGVEFILQEGVEKIRNHEAALTHQFLQALKRHAPHVKVFGPTSEENRVAVISLQVDGYTPAQLSQTLFEKGKLMTRSGLHCAPGAHQTIGSYPTGNTRFSFGYFNTPEEVQRASLSFEDVCS